MHGFSRINSEFALHFVHMGATATLRHSDVTEKIIGIFYDVYNELGYGFLECVYEESHCGRPLTEAGLKMRTPRYLSQSCFAVTK